MEKCVGGHRHGGDGHEQAEPAQPATIDTGKAIGGQPQIRQRKQQRQRSRLDRSRIRIRAEGLPESGQQTENAHEQVDDPDFPVADALQHPQAVEDEHRPHIKQNQSQQHAITPATKKTLRRHAAQGDFKPLT